MHVSAPDMPVDDNNAESHQVTEETLPPLPDDSNHIRENKSSPGVVVSLLGNRPNGFINSSELDLVYLMRLEIIYEKKEKVQLSLDGFDSLERSFSTKKVDIDGHIDLGGLLRVTTGYGTKVSLSVGSDGQPNIIKEWQIEERQLRIASMLLFVSRLENLEFEIVDSEGDVDVNFHDEDKSGESHTLVIKSHNVDEYVKYSFREGSCIVRAVPIPPEIGDFSFIAAHARHQELQLIVKVKRSRMDESQSNPINISNSIGPTTKIPILYTQDYEVWAHHFEDYVIGSEDNGYLIWEAIVSGPFAHSGTSKIIKTQKEYNDLLKDVKDVAQDEKEKFQCNIKALRLIRFALQSDTFRLVSSCSTAKEIWDRLRELYSIDEDLEHSIQTLLLSEFGEFKQNSDETVTQTFDRFNHLLSKMIKHDIERKLIEQKVNFLNGLRSEWRAVVSTIKAHEQFKSYSLAKLVGILKSQEKIVLKEKNVVSSLGSLALLSKSKSVVEDEDLNLEDYDLTSEDYAMMVSNPKRFIKKRFPTNKNRNWQGSYSSEKVKEELKT
ncbi:hypothetical protein Lser_V15G23597 [Lactuca serriola]